MADYKELLRRAITALPENNGSARRAVYEKARSALVGQLRSISPPLPAREITQHRLQLEDCIRQVEQEASEAVIMLGRDGSGARSAASPVRPTPGGPVAAVPEPAAGVLTPVEAPVVGAMSIEDIISQASSATAPAAHDLAVAKPEQGPLPEAGPQIGPVAPPPREPVRAETMAPVEQARAETAPRANTREAVAIAVSPQTVTHETIDAEAAPSSKATASLPMTANVPVQAALASEREVDVEPGPSEAQDVIERAIETLDREARGETTSLPADAALNSFAIPAKPDESASYTPPPAPARSGSGLTIFLVVFAVLLAGAGGAGFWAWREGYVDLDQMFGQAAVTETAETEVTTPTLDPVQPTETAEDVATGPGNTTPATTADEANTELSGLEVDDRLQPTPEAVEPSLTPAALPEANSDEIKTEERLPGAETVALATDDPAASVDPAVLAGSQSLLLEQTPGGETGAVPFSGTVEWSEGVDELGLPTLLGTASIPARNMSVDITIRKNSDPTLPASHLMEADFSISDTFIGGTIATLQGVRLKDQELVAGTDLVGASARVVGNSFLFALSSAPDDEESNTQLLEERRWMDLNVVYGTGRNAIITLEKDDTAQALFEKVFTAWQS